jgi:hypothetical protein
MITTTASFACNLEAIDPSARPRYNELLNRIRSAMQARTEVASGYVFQMDSKVVTLPEAAEWITMERLCCPFLTLQLSTTGVQPHWLLTLTGPEGVKPLLDAGFPVR